MTTRYAYKVEAPDGPYSTVGGKKRRLRQSGLNRGGVTVEVTPPFSFFSLRLRGSVLRFLCVGRPFPPPPTGLHSSRPDPLRKPPEAPTDRRPRPGSGPEHTGIPDMEGVLPCTGSPTLVCGGPAPSCLVLPVLIKSVFHFTRLCHGRHRTCERPGEVRWGRQERVRPRWDLWVTQPSSNGVYQGRRGSWSRVGRYGVGGHVK